MFGPVIYSLGVELSVLRFVLFLSRVGVVIIWWAGPLALEPLVGLRILPSEHGVRNKALVNLFTLFMLLNLISMVNFSYPLSTTLTFNLRLALMLWLARVAAYLLKPSTLATVIPKRSPWYLVPFLALVELVSIRVRPITLAFRLLANISAGHILLGLIAKLNLAWVLGSLFGLLELIVCVIQAFVFVMLISVYFEESIRHSTVSGKPYGLEGAELICCAHLPNPKFGVLIHLSTN